MDAEYKRDVKFLVSAASDLGFDNDMITRALNCLNDAQEIDPSQYPRPPYEHISLRIDDPRVADVRWQRVRNCGKKTRALILEAHRRSLIDWTKPMPRKWVQVG